MLGLTQWELGLAIVPLSVGTVQGEQGYNQRSAIYRDRGRRHTTPGIQLYRLEIIYQEEANIKSRVYHWKRDLTPTADKGKIISNISVNLHAIFDAIEMPMKLEPIAGVPSLLILNVSIRSI